MYVISEERIKNLIENQQKNPNQSIFTKKQIDILTHRFLSESGKPMPLKYVADKMGISVSSVTSHLSAIFKIVEKDLEGIVTADIKDTDKFDEKSVLEIKDLSTRAKNALWKNGITSIAKLKRYANGQYKSDSKLRNAGIKTLEEINRIFK